MFVYFAGVLHHDYFPSYQQYHQEPILPRYRRLVADINALQSQISIMTKTDDSNKQYKQNSLSAIASSLSDLNAQLVSLQDQHPSIRDNSSDHSDASISG